jgi:Bacterial Ig-like domain (group 2)
MRWLPFTLILIVACGGSYSAPIPTSGGNPQALVVQPIGGSPSSIAAPGGMLQLAAYQNMAGPYGNTLQLVTANWSSSDKTVATVDANGLVTAVGNGTATITATADSETGETMVRVGAMPGMMTAK